MVGRSLKIVVEKLFPVSSFILVPRLLYILNARFHCALTGFT